MTIDWQNAIIYSILPMSYYDTDANGRGDLPGVIAKLDYIHKLGVNVIWLGPVYRSGWVDGGYDVIDHCAIDPLFGTMSDLDQLIEKAHDKNIGIMMDLIVNHTSIKHPWFVDAASSRDNPKHDWYTWQSSDDHGDLPNNWLSVFGGSVWEYNDATQEFYLHTFYKEQADLNWRNATLRKEVFEIVRFYQNRGVDGFRVDAASHFYKDPQGRDNPLKENYQQIKDPYEQQLHLFDKNLPQRFEYLNELGSVIATQPNNFMISESYLSFDQLSEVHQHVRNDIHTACNFNLVSCEWKTDIIYESLEKYLELCSASGAIPTWILSNHDRTRIASRLGPQRARLLVMMQMILPGIAFVYYGDEIGMVEVPIPTEFQHDHYAFFNREGQRTPMQWLSNKNGGFSSAKPWLPLGDTLHISVQDQQHHPDSMLNFFRRMIRFKNQYLSTDIQVSLDRQDDIITISLQIADQPYFALLNFGQQTPMPDLDLQSLHTSTYMDQGQPETLRAYEGLLLKK
jgi:alpha-glucosidase